MSETEYKTATLEETVVLARLQNFVFSFNRDEKEIREGIENGKNSVSYCAIEENSRVLAGMEVIPYSMWFDGQKVLMSGIGGVATAPESRRSGHIRKLFEKVFDDIYEQGFVFSHLYPFNYDYYRKFGYEHCGTAKRYTLPSAPARKLKNNGTAHEHLKNDGARDKLIEIHEEFASRHNAMISRSKQTWNEILNIPEFGHERLYYWKNSNSEIKAWVKFKRDGNTMLIHDIAWADNESMFGILQFMGMFEGAASNLKFTSSPEFIPEIYWNSLYEMNSEPATLGMSRIINVKHVFELMKKPNDEGNFSIKVIDDFAEWNNDTYTIEYGSGECSVKTSSNSTADAEMSERALTQMVLGVYDFNALSLRDDVIINSNIDVLRKVFRKKNVFITDGF